MKTKRTLAFGLMAALTSLMAIGCKPKTTSQKIEDKAEDAGHAVGQGVERAGENIQNSTK